MGEPAATVPVHGGLFTEREPYALIGGRCASCGAHHFPFSETCPYCSQQATEKVQLSPQGKLWAWTAVTVRPPGYLGELPYGFGIVELPEGIRVISRLTEADPARLERGQQLQLVLVPLHVDDEGREVLTYAFSPSAIAGEQANP